MATIPNSNGDGSSLQENVKQTDKRPVQRSGMLCVDFESKNSTPTRGNGEHVVNNKNQNGGSPPAPQASTSMGFDQSAQFAQFMGMMMSGFQHMSQAMPKTAKKRAHEMSDEDSDQGSAQEDHDEDDDDHDDEDENVHPQRGDDFDPMEKLGEY